MKKLTVGIAAHVDAGKTTLAEALLYESGARRTLGRVDNGDAFLDHYALERARGITIFSKTARLRAGDWELTLLDTPGHTDLAAETERSLKVLDAAVLVISGSEGVQSHTATLWELLSAYRVPVFLFVNKTDMPGFSREKVLEGLKKLDHRIVPADLPAEALSEELALCSEDLMETVLAGEEIGEDRLRREIRERNVFPCFFGSALKMTGIREFFSGLSSLLSEPPRTESLSGLVYKISRDENGTRLTHLKLNGGTLRVRDSLPGSQEKIGRILLQSGGKAEAVQEAGAGEICVLPGLSETYPGQGIGEQEDLTGGLIEPVLSYDLKFPEGTDLSAMLRNLQILEEEEPELKVRYQEKLHLLQALLMGPVQMEVLAEQVKTRFGTEIGFSAGSVVYRETVTGPAEGVGHYEPLRHYAEVHILIRPGERGSGITADSAVPTDRLDRNWQRLILTHLKEREFAGVLTGSPLTDVRFTIVAGRAHEKHTEGGDFRQAVYRAVRQGLMNAPCALLEPFFDFRLEIPSSAVGRAMTDLTRLEASFSAPEILGESALIRGSGTVRALQNYQEEVTAYTGGTGRISFRVKGYGPCLHPEEVIAARGYDPETDPNENGGSVFCSHGAGFYVPWDEVPDYMHLDSGLGFYHRRTAQEEAAEAEVRYREGVAETEELRAIFERTYGPIKPRIGDWDRPAPAPRPEKPYVYKERQRLKEYLLVDGYNVIHAWPELSRLAEADLGAARTRLQDILSNYQGYKKCEVILVFDAYRVAGHREEIFTYHNIHVVYTKEAETADRYIEKTAHEIGRKYHVTVATSDGVEQVIIRGAGCALLSSRDLLEEVRRTEAEIRERTGEERPTGRHTFENALSPEGRELLKEVRDQ